MDHWTTIMLLVPARKEVPSCSRQVGYPAFWGKAHSFTGFEGSRIAHRCTPPPCDPARSTWCECWKPEMHVTVP